MRATGNGPLSDLRRNLGLTVQQLSERTGIPVGTLGSIESRRLALSRRTLEKLRAAFPESFNGLQAVTNLTDIESETRAMSQIYYALSALDDRARQRAITWALERLETEKGKKL